MKAKTRYGLKAIAEELPTITEKHIGQYSHTLVIVNHYRRLKKAYNQHRWVGVNKYIEALNKR